MRVGDLRKQVTIEAETPTADGGGGYALAWTNVATMWAQIVPLSGSKPYIDGHLESHVTHRITIRWRSDIAVTADMRVIYGCQLFNIRAVLNRNEENHWWDLMVEEGVAT
jgi:SPP1 family predicted phage head-tail adaptor